MKGLGSPPNHVIPLFPLFRIVRVRHHLASPNNPRIREPFCLPCIPPFHHKSYISLFSSISFGFNVLNETVSLKTRRFIPRGKKLARFFSKKTQKVFARNSRKNFHVWHSFFLYDNTAFQKGNYFVVLIFI